MLGFDVVGRSDPARFDHSPLSRNGLAPEWPVNRYCLFETEAQALEAVRRFDERPQDQEPGPHRVVRVDLVA